MSLSVRARPTTAAERAVVGHTPIRRVLALPYRLSIALAVVAGADTAIGVFHPDVYRDPAMTAGNMRGTAVVILAVALPTLVAGMILTARGSLPGQILWLGALGYILYNAVVFAFDTAFNALFLLHVAMLSLSFWSLVALLGRADTGIRARVSPHLPVRPIAIYLLFVAALTSAAWMRQIIPALTSDSVPAGLEATKMLTNPFYVMDLSVTLPLTALSAIGLWQRRPRGYLLAGLFLVMWTIESASVATDQVFGHLSDPTASLAAVPLFAALAMIGLVPTLVFLRNIRQRAMPTADRNGDAPR